MAHETIDHHDHIIHDPEILVGKPVIKGTRIAVDAVLARLATNPSVDALVQDYPELTRDDVRAVMAYAQEKVADTPDFVSPQQFYREATQREDIRRVLEALAK